MIGNCMRPNDTFGRFDALELSPCVNNGIDGTQRCEANAQDFWTIYGCIKDSAEVYALHDAQSEDDAAKWLCDAHHLTGLSVQYSCEAHGRLLGKIDPFSPIDLAMALTEEIHDALPDRDAEDFRDDDFDNHPLAPIRDALCDASGAMGTEVFTSVYPAILFTMTTEDKFGTQTALFASEAEADAAADAWCRKRWDDDWGPYPANWGVAYDDYIGNGESFMWVERHIVQLAGVARKIVKSAKAQMGDLIEQIEQMRGMFDDEDGRIQQAIDDAGAWPHIAEKAE